MESEENIKPFPSLPTVLGNRYRTAIPTLRTARRLRIIRRTYTDISIRRPQRHCSRYTVALPRFNDSSGTQREQADHGANLEPPGTTVGMAQDVIIEPMLPVPHAVRPSLDHGAGDPKEMDDKLDGHVLVHGILDNQLDGDIEHVLAES